MSRDVMSPEEEERMTQDAVLGFEADDDNAFDSEERRPDRLIVITHR